MAIFRERKHRCSSSRNGSQRQRHQSRNNSPQQSQQQQSYANVVNRAPAISAATQQQQQSIVICSGGNIMTVSSCQLNTGDLSSAAIYNLTGHRPQLTAGIDSNCRYLAAELSSKGVAVSNNGTQVGGGGGGAASATNSNSASSSSINGASNNQSLMTLTLGSSSGPYMHEKSLLGGVGVGVGVTCIDSRKYDCKNNNLLSNSSFQTAQECQNRWQHDACPEACLVPGLQRPNCSCSRAVYRPARIPRLALAPLVAGRSVYRQWLMLQVVAMASRRRHRHSLQIIHPETKKNILGELDKLYRDQIPAHRPDIIMGQTPVVSAMSDAPSVEILPTPQKTKSKKIPIVSPKDISDSSTAFSSETDPISSLINYNEAKASRVQPEVKNVAILPHPNLMPTFMRNINNNNNKRVQSMVGMIDSNRNSDASSNFVGKQVSMSGVQGSGRSSMKGMIHLNLSLI
ncbi:GH23977 [Drosophila grimshawi]|uniref:GH23977 n=1 Tax=Drosophila grimshawi TaxID=7222 RepID=B4JZP7_DROGR|nr:GH23977 [Drosophila grimshawi]